MAYKGFINHRWTRVLAFGLAVTFTSCLYAGWQQYSLMLLKGDKYAWLCPPGTRTLQEDQIMSCPEQDRKVSTLFPLAAGFELFGAIVAGVALDRLGPRLTAIIGSISGFISVGLLIISRERLDLMPSSMMITGVAINMIAFPALILEDFFPSAAATTASFVVACQCLSSVIAPVLWALWSSFPRWTFEGIWSAYLAIIWIPCSIFYCLTLPSVRLERNTQETDVELAETKPKPSFAWRPFCSEAFSVRFALLNLINLVLMLQVAYYQVVVRKESGAAVSDFLGWTMPLQAVWGLLLGRVVDRIKTPAMIFLLLNSFMVVYGLMLLGRSKIQYLTVTLFNIAMSYAYTVKYSFVQESFSQTNYGTLVGISGALGGVSVLLTNILTSTRSVDFWSAFLAVCSLVVMPAAVWLWFRGRRTLKSEVEVCRQVKDAELAVVS